MEARYLAFSLDLPWDVFASLDQPKLDRLLERSKFSAAEKEELVELWRDHPCGPARKYKLRCLPVLLFYFIYYFIHIHGIYVDWRSP
jgi:hypothetical protein